MRFEYLQPMINIFYTDRFLQHDTGFGHPERPERLKACVEGIQKSNQISEIKWVAPRQATPEELQLVHTKAHILNVKNTAERGGFSMDPDTMVSPESYDIALRSTGAWLDGVDHLVDQKESSFVLSRPPGHHAEADHAMGFCLFNNCAIAANYAMYVKGIDRVAILDWDVHHGNGTQHTLEAERNMAYCSLHQWPYFPGTGAEYEKGEYNNVLNIPVSIGSGKETYYSAFDKKVLPFLKSWEPELLIVSAGFDASKNDPIGGMQLLPEHFAEFTRYCLDITPHLLVGLEGGYDLTDLADCSRAVAEVLIEHER
ncbi:MAG: histone deacetylase [Candidatus Marinimicrobia bacterium]|nr:histone deacetylase [Candidatus Neomarinimicrobiota bacterium]